MLIYCRFCFVFIFIVNEIICRSIDVANRTNVSTTIDNAVITTTATAEPTPRTFDICEYFDDKNEMDALRLRDRGITVVTKHF